MLLKEKNIPKYVNDDIEFFSHSDKENSDEETFGKENSDEKNSKYTNITHIFKLLLKRIKKKFCVYKNG